MRKKISLLVAFVIGTIALPGIVKAQASFSFDCSTPLDNTSLTNPQTACGLSVIPDPTEGAITNLKVQITSANMDIGNFNTNSAIWNSDGSKDANGFISFTKVDAAEIVGATSIGAVDLTLKNTAHECGKVCIAIAYTNEAGQNVTISNVTGASEAGACKIVVEQPETGKGTTVANYIILAGGTIIAIAAISYARKSTKFYRV